MRGAHRIPVRQDRWIVAVQPDQLVGDLPYPPEDPKMPGEPLRVLPSRAKRPGSENTSN